METLPRLLFYFGEQVKGRTFHNILNTLHPSIQFTTETSESNLPFLDIHIKVCNSKVTTDIFYKKTDTHQYLNFLSCHPPHTKRNIPYCMARRICTIVIEPALQQIRLGELRGFLQLQKYPPKLIDDGIEKAKGLSLSQLRTPRKKVERNIIPFVNTHDPGVTNIFSTMKANLPILLQSPKMRDLIKTNCIINSKRQPINLTRAKFT